MFGTAAAGEQARQAVMELEMVLALGALDQQTALPDLPLLMPVAVAVAQMVRMATPLALVEPVVVVLVALPVRLRAEPQTQVEEAAVAVIHHLLLWLAVMAVQAS